MRALVLLTLMVSSSFCSLQAQISHGGKPYGTGEFQLPDPALFTLPTPELERYLAEDAVNDQYKEIPYRFGVNTPVNLDLHNSGTWTTMDNGDRLWRLGIDAPGAVSINFVFDAYMIPDGGKVFVYSAGSGQVLGSFTRENASQENTLGVGLIFGDKLTVEYIEPASVAGQGYLHIDNITYGYREVLQFAAEVKSGPFGNSGPCNINVNCPEGTPYAIQRRSVAVIVVGNNGLCSGSLVNNTAQNGIPYFLTANHCLVGNLSNWIFYFNHESPGCTGNTGPTNQSISGANLLASHAESDFALLQLNNTPPAGYNVCYNGWDRSDVQASVFSAYGIHHPSGDIKKICFENDAPYHQNVGTFVNQTWWINQWELGVTEGGSSGSPLFNQNGRVIGTLSGGLAACAGTVNNGAHDFYGRFGVAWNFGNSASTRLRDWLDPGNTGVTVLNNSCSTQNFTNDITLGNFANLPGISCTLDPVNASINVQNTGTQPVTAMQLNTSINGAPAGEVNWSGTLAPNAVTLVSIPSIVPENGLNTYTVTVGTVNGAADQNPDGNVKSQNFIAFGDPEYVTVNINFDNYPQETSWNITTVEGTVLYSGGPYTPGTNNFNQSFCLGSGGCYLFNIFDSWGDGICCGFGQGSYSVTHSNGTVFGSGAQFGYEEMSVICLNATLTTDNSRRNPIKLYPNPANDHFLIDASESGQDIHEVLLTDALGRVVWQHNGSDVSGSVLRINTASLATGIYIARISGTGWQTSHKVVLQK